MNNCPHCGIGLQGGRPAPKRTMMLTILKNANINPLKVRDLKFKPYMGDAGSIHFTFNGQKREVAIIWDGANWEYDNQQDDEDEDDDEHYSRPMRIYYKFPGSFHAQGPTTKRFASRNEARDYLEELLGDEWSDDVEFWPVN